MAMAIEAYGTEGAIALAEKYSYNFLSLLLEQTAELRKDPQEREKDNIARWVSENQERSVNIKDESGKVKKINLKSFAAVG